MQAPSEASQITGSSNDTAGTILEARDIAGTIPEARYTTVTGMSNTNLVYASRNPRNCLGLFRVPQFAKNEDVSRHGILQQMCPFLSWNRSKRQTGRSFRNGFTGPNMFRDFRETGPWPHRSVFPLLSSLFTLYALDNERECSVGWI